MSRNHQNINVGDTFFEVFHAETKDLKDTVSVAEWRLTCIRECKTSFTEQRFYFKRVIDRVTGKYDSDNSFRFYPNISEKHKETSLDKLPKEFFKKIPDAYDYFISSMIEEIKFLKTQIPSWEQDEIVDDIRLYEKLIIQAKSKKTRFIKIQDSLRRKRIQK